MIGRSVAAVRHTTSIAVRVAIALSLVLPATGFAQAPTVRAPRAVSLDAAIVGIRSPRPSSPLLLPPAIGDRSLGPKATSGTVWSIAGAAGGLLIGVLVGESIRQGTQTDDSTTNEYNAKMATTVGLGLLVPLGAALGAAYGVNNIGLTHGNKNAVKGVALATAYAAAAVVIATKIKRDDPDLVRYNPNREIVIPLPVAAVLSSLAAALITDAATRK